MIKPLLIKVHLIEVDQQHQHILDLVLCLKKTGRQFDDLSINLPLQQLFFGPTDFERINAAMEKLSLDEICQCVRNLSCETIVLLGVNSSMKSGFEGITINNDIGELLSEKRKSLFERNPHDKESVGSSNTKTALLFELMALKETLTQTTSILNQQKLIFREYLGEPKEMLQMIPKN